MANDDPASTDKTSLSEVFDVLTHGSRRRILLELADHNPRTAAEFEAEEFAVGEGNHDSPKIELHHTHLPALADAGFINWDSQTGTITRGPRFGEIEPLLTLIDDQQEGLPTDWP
ncbi:helix-turn-helix domain-containing protein [Halosolutus halophilus]|uniref:helix-turn-helix domain-containing protein n=1 Tax=Halosolutus halophilus TaxID=1552990 RepID=UPI002234F6EE|nr:helix-turn-helix domain-containing protein [Halosolutus halophilus]